MSFRALVRVLPVLAVVFASACSESSGNNRPGPPAKIVLVSGPMFTATVGAPLPAPLVARVTDADDRPVPGVVVTFAVPGGAATLGTTRDTTDAQGEAQTTLTLGTVAGTVEVHVTVTGITGVARITGIAVAGPLARVLVAPKPVVLGAVGDTVRLRASLFDQYNNPVPPSAVTWRSLDESIVAVDATGLVTARRIGASTQVIASTAGGLSDTVTVSVADPNAPVCSTAGVALAVGQTTTLDPSAGACITASATSEYVVVPFFASAVGNATTDQLNVVATGVTAFPALSASVGPSPSLSGAAQSLSSVMTPQRSGSVERRLREVERRELAPRFAAARAARKARTSTGPSFNMIPTAAVGEFITINASATSACETPVNRRGRVAAISQKAVIVSDTGNAPNGFTDADFARIAAMFDTLVVPVNDGAFGAPGDMDGNGRSVIFYTPEVNKLTSPGSGQYTGGFFWVRDLFPKVECATSNAGEIFYMLAPDPNAVYGNAFSKAFVEQVTVATLAHEYQHLINASRRFANPAAASFEVVWLNEGMSHIAEELVFYRAASRTPRSNIGGEAFGSSPFDQAYANYMHQNIGRLRSWLVAPQSNSPYGDNDELATRGSTWSFLRYLADRTRASDGDVWQRLVDNGETGMANVAEVFNINTISAVKDWTVAIYADDFVPSVAAIHTMPSWNLRTLYPGMGNSTLSSIRNSGLRGPYPLLTLPLSDGVGRSVTLKGGATSYFPFAIAAGKEAQVYVTAAGGVAPPSSVVVTIMRTK